jgi:hypothetical protein
MATTLERASFAAPIGAVMRMKFDNPAGIAAGNTLTITLPDGSTLAGNVTKLLPYGAAKMRVTTCSRLSGLLLIPKGSTVA